MAALGKMNFWYTSFLLLVCNLQASDYKEKSIFEKAKIFSKAKDFHRSYETMMELWRAYNETEKIGGPHGVGLAILLIYAQGVAQKLQWYGEAKYLCDWALANVKLSSDMTTRFESSAKFCKYKTASKYLENIEAMPIFEQKKIAEEVSSHEAYNLCNDSIARQRLEKLSQDAKLICRYNNRGNNPILLLAPVKEEIVNYDPLLVLFHDIILPKDVQTLQKLTNGNLTNATLGGKNYVNAEIRKAQVAWINGFEVKTLDNRIAAYTGLKIGINESQDFQVCRYGIGGHYLEHVDSWKSDAKTRDHFNGNRLATLLLYANDVAKGGSTVFTKLGLSVRPERGAGLFWYNLFRNETTDFRTAHAGCPVTEGEKWIINKWFLSRGNWRQMPCGLTPEQNLPPDYFELPVLSFPN